MKDSMYTYPKAHFSAPSLYKKTVVSFRSSPLPLFLPTTHQPTHPTSRALRPISYTPRTPLDAISSTLAVPAQRPLAFKRPALLVLAATLSTVDTLLGYDVTDGLCETALAHLSGYQAVYAVLEVVDLSDACDFGFVEGVWCDGLAGMYDWLERKRERDKVLW